MTSSVEECALRARSTHDVHHAIVEVNIVIGVVLVARVVPVVVDAVICLTVGLIAHVVIVVFVVAIINRIFLYGRYTLYSCSLRSQSLFLSLLYLFLAYRTMTQGSRCLRLRLIPSHGHHHVTCMS